MSFDGLYESPTSDQLLVNVRSLRDPELIKFLQQTAEITTPQQQESAASLFANKKRTPAAASPPSSMVSSPNLQAQILLLEGVHS